MSHSCPQCERNNAPHRESCLYCGAVLPEPTAAPPVRAERTLPTDIDQLVKQAMTFGATHKLREAMLSHREDTPALPEATEEPPEKPRETLERIRGAANAALEAFDRGKESDVHSALARIKAALSAFGTLREVSEAPAAEGPVICLPKVRRRYGLVMEGLGDVERHPLLTSHLGMDAATARMMAIARQPRVVLRGDDEARLRDMAIRLHEEAGLQATVVDEARLLSIGPAWLLHGFESGPILVPIIDWSQPFETPAASPEGRAMVDPPLLVVPGEVVVLKYRSSRSSGRLKHLRDGRMQAASEQRLALIDLHTASGIVRILEGHSNLSNAPGAVSDGFRRSLRALIDNWKEQDIPVLEPRTCSPGMQGGQTANGLDQSAYSTGWPDWEEHSRAAGALFIGDELRNGRLGEALDLPTVDPEPTSGE
jgi:hypothetical protein